jgi:hypothetical protein
LFARLHSNISEEEGSFIQGIIREARPQVSLEVGCAYGVSSLYICEALCEVNAVKHIIIDSHQSFPYGKDHRSGWEGIGLANLRRAGYIDLVDFYEVPSHQGLSRLIEERATIDFAFVDGAHTFDYVLVDVFLIDKLLRPGGIIILDDLLYPSIRSVCRYVLLNLRYKCAGPKTPDMPAWRRLRSVGAKICRGGAFELARDMRLNFPLSTNYIALQKLEDDLIGDGHGATRHWTDHTPFC